MRVERAESDSPRVKRWRSMRGGSDRVAASEGRMVEVRRGSRVAVGSWRLRRKKGTKGSRFCWTRA